jgi:hypothetical protein
MENVSGQVTNAAENAQATATNAVGNAVALGKKNLVPTITAFPKTGTQVN